MGDWQSSTYILSQILTFVGNALIGYSFFLNRRIALLLVTLAANIFITVAYGFLGGWVGVGVICVEIARDIVSFISDKRKENRNSTTNTRFDSVMLAIWVTALIVITIFTQDGFLSWFALFATLTFTVGIWQKNQLIFLICAVASEVFWIVYNVVVESAVGLGWEIVLFIAAIAGLWLFLHNRYGRTSQWYLRSLALGHPIYPSKHNYSVSNKATRFDLWQIMDLDKKVHKQNRLVTMEKLRKWTNKNSYI